MKPATFKYTGILNDIPGKINDASILLFLQKKEVNWKYVDTIKQVTDFNDEVISDWLNVSVRTFRSYRKPQNKFKDNVKEHVLLLLSLIKHGIQVFGTVKEFDQWLNTSNFFFDGKNPVNYLNTVTGIRFVDDRLTAMEYGDNA